MCWFSESDRNFFPSDQNRVLEIERTGDRVVLRVHLIDAPHSIDRALDYTFGFQATPDAWDYRTVHMGRYGLAAEFVDRLAGYGARTMCFCFPGIEAVTRNCHVQEGCRQVRRARTSPARKAPLDGKPPGVSIALSFGCNANRSWHSTSRATQWRKAIPLSEHLRD